MPKSVDPLASLFGVRDETPLVDLLWGTAWREEGKVGGEDPWVKTRRPNQTPPPGNWQTWLLLAGRGFGKTRTAMEWVREKATTRGPVRIALVGATANDTRRIMVEGESGLLAICERYGIQVRYGKSSLEIDFPASGAKVLMYSADEPNRLRGAQHHYAAADELAAWRYEDAWDQLQFGLRLGQHPQQVVATTPRPKPVILRLLNDQYDAATNPEGTVVVSSGSTYENQANLAPSFIQKIVKRYEGTRLGRQELHAEVLMDVPGALWSLETIERGRVDLPPPAFDRARVVVGVDPMAGDPKQRVASEEEASETGIVVACVDHRGEGYVLDDFSVGGTPLEWGSEVVKAYRAWDADRIVAESNNGGLMVEQTLRTIDPNLPISLVWASRGKLTRAEPVSALYEQGRVHHVGTHARLEDQMTSYDGSGSSPDRMDALVWALTDLMVNAPPSQIDPALAAAFRGLPASGAWG